MEIIPLSLRLKEIVEDRGIKYADLEKMVDKKWSDSTLSRMANGGRVIYNTDVVFLAKALGIKYERFTREDIAGIESQLDLILEKKQKVVSTMRLARKLLNTSIGVTEKVYALNRQAKVFILWGGHKEAREAWSEAAALVKGKQGYEELHFQMEYNLLFSYLDTREVYKLLVGIDSFSKSHQSFLESDPFANGRIKYLKAAALLRVGDLREAEENYLSALNDYESAAEHTQKWGILHSLAEIRFVERKFELAIEYIEKAVTILAVTGSSVDKVRVKKDYARLLLLEDRNDEAIAIIEECIYICKTEKFGIYKDLSGLLLMKVFETNDEVAASEIISMVGIPNQIRHSAAQFLLCKKNTDASLSEYLDIIAKKDKSYLMEVLL